MKKHSIHALGSVPNGSPCWRLNNNMCASITNDSWLVNLFNGKERYFYWYMERGSNYYFTTQVTC